MKFFNFLLEALHSSMIDELTARYPEPRPELGMPVRAKGFDAPAGCSTSLIIRVSGKSAEQALNGWVIVSCDGSFSRALPLQDLWAALQQRAQPEFARRGIQPKFSPPSVAPARIADPSGTPQPARVIWVPFRVGPGVLQLGVGI